MATQCAPNIEVPDGYALADRLGAGGYGEVWKATAPGGVEKAIKVVFGHCDEELAERECKALDRIRSVRHPFLLSIERYEVVNHRLVIVTELADRSLDARFKECRGEGLPGVPRDELINYLADAAEALDCLSERYSLQHLDVKPENLLLVGEHVKVADFGLVKDIASQTLNSMIGGMTPLYSPPELYDDDPSQYSDQYSLAIVYQQMLTGDAPFSGRTPAQLAKQHMQAAPMLTPLNEHDRQVVGRALAKDPTRRFSSCKQFVAALRGEAPAAPSPAPPTPAATGPSAGSSHSDETKSAASINTAPIGDRKPPPPAPHPAAAPAAAKSSAKPRTSFPAVSAEVIDLKPPAAAPAPAGPAAPTLVIGLGGVGGALLGGYARSRADAGVACLAIDTDSESLKAAANNGLERDELLHTPLRRPRDYRDDSQDLLKWLSRRWLYNIPRSLTTRGFRPLGRLALVDHAERVLEALYSRLQQLAQASEPSDSDPPEIQVVLLAGASGGSGSGAAIDVAQAARSVAHELGVGVRVRGVFASTFRPDSQDSLAASNMYALLEELHHAQRHGNRGDGTPGGAAAFYERDDRPFDELRIVNLPTRNEPEARDRALGSVGALIRLETSSTVVQAAEPPLTAADADAGVTFAHHRCADLAEIRSVLNQQRNQQRVREFARFCLKADSGLTDPAAEPFGRYANSRLTGRLLELVAAPSAGLEPAQMSEAARLRSERLELAAPALLVLEACLHDSGGDDSAGQLTAEQAPAFAELLDQLAQGVARHEDARRYCEEFLRVGVPARLKELEGANSDVEQRLREAVREIATMEPPLNCGYRRLAYLIGDAAAIDGAPGPLAEGLPRLQPLPAAGLGEQLLLLGAGITPLHLGARLAESFADIEEAAGRLHAREDIEWDGLR